MKPILNGVLITWLALAAHLQQARAQEVSAYVGFGGAYDASNGLTIDTFGDGTLHKTPPTRGPMAQLGMTVFLGKRFGAGAEISRRLGQGDYAGLDYGLSFSSIDAVFRPVRATMKKFEPEYRVGLGTARLHYSINDPSNCAQIAECPVSTHFQMRVAAAGHLYISNHVYFRPAVDLHYVNDFSEFRNNWVPEYSIGIGYAVGR